MCGSVVASKSVPEFSFTISIQDVWLKREGHIMEIGSARNLSGNFMRGMCFNIARSLNLSSLIQLPSTATSHGKTVVTFLCFYSGLIPHHFISFISCSTIKILEKYPTLNFVGFQ